VADSVSNPASTISGIDVMRGVGAKPSKPFWADAWDRVVKRWGARIGLAWIAIIALFAVLAPVVATGLPVWTTETVDGEVVRSWSPLWEGLDSVDVALLLGLILGVPWIMLPSSTIRLTRSHRIGVLIAAAVQCGVSLLTAELIGDWLLDVEQSEGIRSFAGEHASLVPWVGAVIGAVVGALIMIPLATFPSRAARIVLIVLVATASTVIAADRFSPPLSNYDRYIDRELTGRYENTWAIIPWSPTQARTAFYTLQPGSTVESRIPDSDGTFFGKRTFLLGTDSVGQDVLSQMLHACRLSISIGLVSTGISVLIGIIVGSLMGYFGGAVDLVLSRIVEIFMAIPVLFLLIVAAAVLPRNTYMMMAIIGCVSWTLPARFIRAEFLKLRAQDFVQAARAAGLPLRSVLFKHMLPNGLTPVLVQASFSIAAAILAEATLSYLGLGPDGQASWGKLLSSASTATGTFNWWLAIFPGFAIFLTVLAYNLLGESFRDAIDPKLRKAAH
jgi:peptide/nickel transport system permease protein